MNRILHFSLLAGLALVFSSCKSFRKGEDVSEGPATPGAPVIGPDGKPVQGAPSQPVAAANIAQAPRPAPKPSPKPAPKPSKPSPYANPTRGLKNATVSAPRALPPGSHYVYGSVSNTGGKYIAITYDDGPHPTHTPRLLDILKARNIKATFYVTGKNSVAYPSILRRMIREGHEIGNHTWKHDNLNTLSKEGIRNDLNKTSNAIFSATGVRPRTMRPPYGAFTTANRQWCRSQLGYPTILWSVDPRDWKDRNSSIVTRRLIDGAKPGAILLAHDIHATTISAMPNTLDGLLQRGYKFVTVSQLISLGRQNGAAFQPPHLPSPERRMMVGQPRPPAPQPIPANLPPNQGPHPSFAQPIFYPAFTRPVAASQPMVNAMQPAMFEPERQTPSRYLW